MACIRRFGEFEESEFDENEFFVGILDCSTPMMGVECNRLLIYPKPFISPQRNIDYKEAKLKADILQFNEEKYIVIENNDINYISL